MSIIAQSYFHDERAALVELEHMVWPTGPVCPHCGADDRIGSVVGKGARLGLKFCCRCRKQFRATLGTMFEGSHVPLHKWFQACFLLAASNGRISAHQLHLRLEVTNKTALCMVRRLLLALRAEQRAAAEAPASGNDWDAAERPRPRWRNRTAAKSTSRAGVRGGESSLVEAEALPWVKPPLGAPRQFLGFLEVARELGCEEDEGRFAAALKQVAAQPGRLARAASERAGTRDVPPPAAPLWPLPQMSLVPLPEEAALPAVGVELC